LSWLDFVTRMTEALAWPLVVVTCVLVLRRHFARILAEMSLKRLKAGPVEAEFWEQKFAETEIEVRAVPVASVGETAQSIQTELSSEVSRAPAVAVLEAHSAVERELRSIVESLETRTSTTGMGAAGMARVAARAGVITEASVRAVEGVSVLRNLAAHGDARRISSEQAAEYVALVDAVLYTLRDDRQRASGKLDYSEGKVDQS